MLTFLPIPMSIRQLRQLKVVRLTSYPRDQESRAPANTVSLSLVTPLQWPPSLTQQASLAPPSTITTTTPKGATEMKG